MKLTCHCEDQAECSCDAEGIYALAAKNGERCGVLISNITGEAAEIATELSGDFAVYIIDKDNIITRTEYDPDRFILNESTVAFIKNY